MLLRLAPFVLILTACASQEAHLAGISPQQTAVDGLLASARSGDQPGCAFSAFRNGNAVLERTYGLANIEQPRAIQLDTVFEAGSVSKQFTAAAVAVLAANGKISLEDDVRKYLPEMRDYGSAITIRMMLTHTSGVRNWDDLVELAGRSREDASGLRQRDAFDIIVRQSALNFAPGAEYLYSNSNYVLAAAIVERVSGLSFPEFIRRELFEPAGMTRTQWRDDYTRVVLGRAVAYTPDDSGELHIDMPFEDVIGPGGLLTTVGDLQRWNQLLDDPTLAAQPWVNLMTTQWGTLTDGTHIPYGMGLEKVLIGGKEVISHAGATAGYRSYLARAPQEGVSLALLCNAGELNTEDLGPQLVALFLAPSLAGDAAVVPRPAGTIAPDLPGQYRNTSTGARVDVLIDQAGLRFNNGPPFQSAGEDLLVNAAGTRQASALRNEAGVVASIRLTRIGNSAVTLEPVAAWSPDTTDLSAFAGAYRADDVGADWIIAMDGPTLRATGPKGEAFLLDPLYADAFAAREASWTFVFLRNPDGSPVSMSLFKARTRGVIFERLPIGR